MAYTLMTERIMQWSNLDIVIQCNRWHRYEWWVHGYQPGESRPLNAKGVTWTYRGATRAVMKFIRQNGEVMGTETTITYKRTRGWWEDGPKDGEEVQAPD